MYSGWLSICKLIFVAQIWMYISRSCRSYFSMAAETSEFLTKCILVGELVMCIPTHVLKGFKPLSHHTLKGMLLHNDFGSSGCRLYEDISEPITPVFQYSSSKFQLSQGALRQIVHWRCIHQEYKEISIFLTYYIHSILYCCMFLPIPDSSTGLFVQRKILLDYDLGTHCHWIHMDLHVRPQCFARQITKNLTSSHLKTGKRFWCCCNDGHWSRSICCRS